MSDGTPAGSRQWADNASIYSSHIDRESRALANERGRAALSRDSANEGKTREASVSFSFSLSPCFFLHARSLDDGETFPPFLDFFSLSQTANGR